MEWVRYFVGTPQRATRTLLGIGCVMVMVVPGLLRQIVERLLNEVAPLFGPLITLIVVFYGIKIIIHGRK